MKKYYTVYKITNSVNNKIYIGAHETNNLNDDYMGSGVLIRRAHEKHGIENFGKEIIQFCDSKDEMYSLEKEIVNDDFLKRDNVYNIKEGGEGGFDHLKGTVTVKDKDGNTSRISIDDQRYLSGELVGITKGKMATKDKDGAHFYISKDDPRYLSGELVSVNKGWASVKDKFGNTSRVSIDDPRYVSGELVPVSKGMLLVKDKCGNTSRVSIDDPRYLSGELVFVLKGVYKGGFHHSEETREKMKNANLGEKNPQYGKIWIYSLEEKKNKMIPKTDMLPKGWLKGRKNEFYRIEKTKG